MEGQLSKLNLINNSQVYLVLIFSFNLGPVNCFYSLDDICHYDLFGPFLPLSVLMSCII